VPGFAGEAGLFQQIIPEGPVSHFRFGVKTRQPGLDCIGARLRAGVSAAKKALFNDFNLRSANGNQFWRAVRVR